MSLDNKSYVVILQCHIVKERCSGYYCERSLTLREDGFAEYPADTQFRSIQITCGGCCGLATQRKISDLLRSIRRNKDGAKENVIVQLSSCMTRDSYHGPPCPHLDFIKVLLDKLGLDYLEDTHISKKAEERRLAGQYKSKEGADE